MLSYLDLGYDNARNVAEKESFAGDVGGVEESEEEEEAEEQESAAKYLRLFTESDDQKFSVFAEFGINRKFTAKLVADYEVELNVQLPVPPDELIIAAGYHAVQVDRLDELDEDYYFQAPEGRRFSVIQGPQSRKPSYFPNEQFPEWVIFTFQLEPKREEVKVSSNVNFRENLLKLQRQAEK